MILMDNMKIDYWEIATRQMTIVDKNQQNLFKNAKIAVIGCGGIGGAAIEILARMGVGQLNIIDEDEFDVSNLNRQLMSSIDTIGKSKAITSKERVQLINPHTIVNAFDEKLTENNLEKILKDCDVIIDALDNIYTRIIVSRYAKENNIPFIHGAIHGTLGQLSVFTKDTKSYEELFLLPSANKELNKETKELLCEDVAFESPLERGVFPLPSNSTFIKPPTVKEFEVAVFNNNKWNVEKDFRKKPYYDPKDYWWAEPQYMSTFGNIPQGMSFEKIEVPEDVIKCSELMNEVGELKSFLDSTDKKELELQAYSIGLRKYLTEEDVKELEAIRLERDEKASLIRPKNNQIDELKNKIAEKYGEEALNHLYQ